MTTSLDVILLPLCRQNSQDMPELAGLYATQAPRRAARGRSLDTLVIHLALEGTAPLSQKGYQKLVGYLADTYFKTPGSATAAMRSVAERLNETLVERNLRGSNRSMQSVGLLTLAVFRGNYLYLAQCGPAHVFVISAAGLSHIHEPNLVGRGLGLGQALNIRYHQLEISSGDSLLISVNPPPIWTTPVLNGLRGMSLDKLHLHLIHRTGPELQAALIQVEAGSGKLRVLRPVVSGDQQATQGVALKIQRTIEPKASMALQDTIPVDAMSAREMPARVVSQPKQEFPPQADESPALTTAPQVAEPRPPQAKLPRNRFVGPAVLKVGQAVGETLRQIAQSLGKLVKRMLPDESLLSVPTSVMAFIAIAVPIVVVSVAATAYVQRGQGRLYEEHYLQAQYAAEQALQLSEAPALREAWNIVLGHLDEAENYQVTDNSQAMRTYAQTVLDNLDDVIRLPFQPALESSLPKDASISRIVVAEGDGVLYLLNATDGHVLKALRTDKGYALDPNFFCEPVPTPLIVGPLVDIIPLPVEDQDNAVILGMDANGNLMKCLSNGDPPLTFQMPPPDMNWGTPTAFVMNSLGIYVLDPMTNAVWIFWSSDELAELPTLFFDEQIPPMGDVIDLTLNRDDLYLLHNDGHLTTCTFGYPTRCDDPAMINDLRQGGSSNPTIDNAIFREIQFASPPDPSLYLLEPNKLSIYHFSVRLTFQHQYRPQNLPAEGPATAFAISSSHQAFLALGNQVFFAALP
jgi:hypothetical protein